MAITVKITSDEITDNGRLVGFAGFEDGEQILSASLNFARAATADEIKSAIFAAVQRAAAEAAATPPDISGLLDQELGEQDVDPIYSMGIEDLRLARKRELQAAMNNYLSKKSDGTDRYTPYLFLAIFRTRASLDMAVAAGQTLTSEQQALADRLDLCQTQFLDPVMGYYAQKDAAITQANREGLESMSFDFSQFDGLDPDVKLAELGS